VTAGHGASGAGGGKGAPRGRRSGSPGHAPEEHNRPPRPHALHRYGQNHLVDRNVLRAIVEQAAVTQDDVVLEVGAADGQLTRPVLERARLVHAFEIDRRYSSRLTRLAAEHADLRVHEGDALKSDLSLLDPPPTALVANLAYNIAIPLIMTSIATLPTVEHWAVMVQRELAERLFATPSTKAYAAVSVLVQLACRKVASRPVPATAFRPQPRVESAFVSFVRRRADESAVTAAEYRAMDRLVRLAFGQRRKVLTNTLAGAALGGVTLSRETVRRTLEDLGLSAAARPEELAPPQWVTFARRAGWLESDAAAGDEQGL
jgi:16S rRNA (adenine1518-N6/adenine1519-N6)-dimethyltransferase